MGIFRGNAILQWIDPTGLGSVPTTLRVLQLREPLRELRAGARQNVYVADSLDFQNRQTFTIGSAPTYEFTGRVRFADHPQGLIDFLVAGSMGQSVSYFPNINEILITAGLVAGEMAGYIVLVKVFPILAGAPRMAPAH